MGDKISLDEAPELPPVDDSHPNPAERGDTAGPRPDAVADQPGAEAPA